MADDRKQKQDEFWDISRLVPRRPAAARPFSQGPQMAEVTSAPKAPTADASAAERRITPPPKPTETTERVYTPEGNSLIRSVTVRRTTGGYSFFEQFRMDARRLFDKVGSACRYVPFFSWAPQYSQLSEAQRDYYFYFRAEVRAGRYPKADKGYFMLLAYEVINLPDVIPPPEGARLLAALWGAYRADLHGIDRYMSAWMMDYCLMHAIPCPPLSADCLAAVADGDGMEFYIGNLNGAEEEDILRVIHLSSEYRFEASRAITDENRAAFRRHIAGAMARVLPRLLSTDGKPERQQRTAFFGSLSAYNMRTELTVEYISLRHAVALRHTIGLAVKYAENHLRAALGIRARLQCTELPADLRALVDSYFREEGARLAAKRPTPPPPAYERLYDAPTEGRDPASAAEIEAASWALTRRLVTEEDEVVPVALTPPAPVAEEPRPAAVEVPVIAPVNGGGDDLCTLVDAFLRGGNAPRAIAQERGIPLATAAERVNEEFLTVLGDVLLTPDGDGFTLIEEYREDAEAWLKTNKK